ncbi:MAG: hypothetical protein IJF38_07695 [Clostridia bacterium]|nr:hypothetical protein [Clostridia bacterium]
MIIDKGYYPGFVRKAITFTIDDGNLKLDKKFIDIVRPAGVFGTFNLSGADLVNHTKEEYTTLYEGFGIANHCKCHPFAFDPAVSYTVSEDAFSSDTADASMLYKTEREGLYYYRAKTGWRKIADKDTYLSLVDEGLSELEAVFGKGAVKSYVWPYYEQKDQSILDAICARGYRSLRKTGEVKDSTSYALPSDRARWSYNSNHLNLLTEAKKYDEYPDDGELKFFAFGVHSHDFENSDNWCDLEAFCELYGNRREDFYYASVDDIFDYQDAMEALVVTECSVTNPSDIPLYVRLNGEFVIITPNSTVTV